MACNCTDMGPESNRDQKFPQRGGLGESIGSTEGAIFRRSGACSLPAFAAMHKGLEAAQQVRKGSQSLDTLANISKRLTKHLNLPSTP